MNTFTHYTDNPMEHTETTLNFDPVSLSWNNPSAHSSVRSRFGHLAQQASPTDDGDILCHSNVAAFVDTANTEIGAERNRQNKGRCHRQSRLGQSLKFTPWSQSPQQPVVTQLWEREVQRLTPRVKHRERSIAAARTLTQVLSRSSRGRRTTRQERSAIFLA